MDVLLIPIALYRLPVALAEAGWRMSFWTRQDSISPAMISFGLRQSIM
jgi:hypothetical protein